jgi:hypothetical protein
MDILTFISEMVKSLAWPAASLIIAVVFRNELRTLLRRVTKGKVGPAEFEFEKTVAALHERVGKVETSTLKTDSVLVNQATQEPRTVILNSWLQVQEIVESIVSKHTTPEDLRDSRSISLRVLHRLLRDKPEYIDMYNDLRLLRNRAVNDIDFSPRPSSVVQYAELANELINVLRPYASDS